MSEPNSSNHAAFSELAGLLLSTDSFEDLMQQIAELAARKVPRAATCGITLAEQGRVYTVASADELATQLDEQQYERDTGPCLEALRTGRVVEVEDMAVEQRWDGYATVAMSHGILSVVSTPLLVDDGPARGVLNLYGREIRAFDARDRELIELLAGQAAIAVTAALRHYDEVTLSENLRTALSSRSVIDQAIGIVMAQARCSAEDAFARLRTMSQRRNVKLRAVAAELVAATERSAAASPPT